MHAALNKMNRTGAAKKSVSAAKSETTTVSTTGSTGTIVPDDCGALLVPSPCIGINITDELVLVDMLELVIGFVLLVFFCATFANVSALA